MKVYKIQKFHLCQTFQGTRLPILSSLYSHVTLMYFNFSKHLVLLINVNGFKGISKDATLAVHYKAKRPGPPGLICKVL